MDPLIIAAAITANSAVLVAWIGRRSNGHSPLAKKLDKLDRRVRGLEQAFAHKLDYKPEA